jgi:hypothetical protein
MQSLHEKMSGATAWLWRMVLLVLSPVAWLLRHLLGNLSWQAPGWLQWAGERMAPLGRKAQDQAAWVALAVLLALGGVWGATHGPQGGWKNWWNWQTFDGAQQDAPKITATGISVFGPERTPYEGDAKPRPVVLNFSASAAPLARVGKEAVDVSLSPALAGKWTWATVNRLEFLPDQDWPIGETYTVNLGAKALAPHVSADRTLTFKSPAFAVDFKNATFYQDPVQVTLRKAVFDVGFSHPVNPETFEKRLRLETDGAAAGVFSQIGRWAEVHGDL